MSGTLSVRVTSTEHFTRLKNYLVGDRFEIAYGQFTESRGEVGDPRMATFEVTGRQEEGNKVVLEGTLGALVVRLHLYTRYKTASLEF